MVPEFHLQENPCRYYNTYVLMIIKHDPIIFRHHLVIIQEDFRRRNRCQVETELKKMFWQLNDTLCLHLWSDNRPSTRKRYRQFFLIESTKTMFAKSTLKFFINYDPAKNIWERPEWEKCSVHTSVHRLSISQSDRRILSTFQPYAVIQGNTAKNIQQYATVNS